MVSIVVHFMLGLACIAWIIASNRTLFAKPASGPWLSPLECVYYAVGIASIVLGYYFNINFVGDAQGRATWSRGRPAIPNSSRGQFANPAAARASRTT